MFIPITKIHLLKKKKQKKKNLKIESGQIKKLKEKLKIYRSFLI
jgi:hypothetical protein